MTNGHLKLHMAHPYLTLSPQLCQWLWSKTLESPLTHVFLSTSDPSEILSKVPSKYNLRLTPSGHLNWPLSPVIMASCLEFCTLVCTHWLAYTFKNLSQITMPSTDNIDMAPHCLRRKLFSTQLTYYLLLSSRLPTETCRLLAVAPIS